MLKMAVCVVKDLLIRICGKRTSNEAELNYRVAQQLRPSPTSLCTSLYIGSHSVREVPSGLFALETNREASFLIASSASRSQHHATLESRTGHCLTYLETRSKINSCSAIVRSEYCRVVLALLPIAAVSIALLQGCGSPISSFNSSAGSNSATISLEPANASIQVGQSLQFLVTGISSDDECMWKTSQASVLAYLGNTSYEGNDVGSAKVTVQCSNQSASASVTVMSAGTSGPLAITSGGLYSGKWVSEDPNVPVLSVETDEPVTIQNSVISGRGTLIRIGSKSSGARVTVQNVTATGIDPEVAGVQRGAFVVASQFDSLIVKNCSMYGVSSGVMAVGASPSVLQILNNRAISLDDRASDGTGGLLSSRPRLGHFVILNNINAVNGAEIAWNEDEQEMGQSSIEDVINIYESHGTQSNPIWVHDNYMSGSSSPSINGKYYTGTALITDGSSTQGASPTAFVRFESNVIVQTAGSGIGIAYGHDVTAVNNRIVSCGKTASGAWYAWGANAVVIWNYYKIDNFYNNTISGTMGGMIGPGQNGIPVAYNIWAYPGDVGSRGNSISSNGFTDPCLTVSGLNLKAEDDERVFWDAKVTSAGVVIGSN